MQQTTTKISKAETPFVQKGADNEDVRVRLWTQDEYYKMAELGFFRGKRVELIEGEIIEMSPMKSLHATAVLLVIEILRQEFKKGYVVSGQLPMTFSKISEPEPDAMVVKGEIRDFLKAHPKT